MPEAIFLSAGVPDPKSGPDFAATANAVAIASAVSALVFVTLGRRILVWGGQPSITPMIWTVAEDVGVQYGDWVRLYQSRFFEEEFPEDNERFRNVTFTDGIDNDREKSLLVMREKMLTDYEFKAAVFIGGMGGIIQEFDMVRRLQPRAAIIPVISTGGAVLTLRTALPNLADDLSSDLDYVAVFHRHLDVSVRERRFKRPQEQPESPDKRYWQPPKR